MKEVIQREEECNDLILKQKILLDKANEEIVCLRNDITQLIERY